MAGSINLSIRDIHFLDYFLSFGKILGITLGINGHNSATLKLKFSSKIKSVFAIFFQIFFALWLNSTRNFHFIIYTMGVTMLVLHMIVHCLMVILPVYSIINLNFMNIKKFYKMMSNFELVDRKLGNLGSQAKNLFYNFYFIVGLLLLLLFSAATYQFIYMKNYMNIYITAISAYAMLYNIYIIVLIIALLKCLKVRYEDLKKLVYHTYNINEINTIKGCLIEAQSICKLLETNVHLFNKLFGFQLLFLMGFCWSQIVASAMLLIRNTQFLGSIPAMVLFIIFVIYIIFLCDGIDKEVEQIVRICNKCRSSTTSARSNREEVFQNFGDVVKEFKPEFTAAGFFTISKATIFSLINVAATYVVVAVQFNQSEPGEL